MIGEFPFEPDQEPAETKVHILRLVFDKVIVQFRTRIRKEGVDVLQLTFHSGLVDVEVVKNLEKLEKIIRYKNFR